METGRNSNTQNCSFKDVEFEKFTTEEEGRLKSKNNWFWVIDPDVNVLDDFNFDFIPDVWDEGKTLFGKN